MDKTKPCTEGESPTTPAPLGACLAVIRTLSRSLVLMISLAGAIGVAQEVRSEVARNEILEAIQKSTRFFRTQVAVQGGYVYQVSADGRYREGEGDARDDIVWVQPPGTPAIGMAYLEAFRATGESELLEAALEVADCLRKGQLHSGGWQNHILLGKKDRPKFAYRVDGPIRKKAKNWSSLDDDQTQSVIRFLALLDHTLKGQDPKVHELLETALQGLLANQFPNGAWAQGFEKLEPPQAHPIVPSRFPKDWPRQHPGGDYWVYYTLNDNALVRVLDTLWMVYDLTGQSDIRDAALRGADFLLLAQMPEPQPAWAQQYNWEMEPVWARKFEPPAISGGESQQAIEHLLDVLDRTGDRKFLHAAEKAWTYLNGLVENQQLARFYELQTNTPLYFTRDYKLTYDPSDVPTHYAFRVPSRLATLGKRIEKWKERDNANHLSDVKPRQWKDRFPKPSQEELRRVIESLNAHGAWVETGNLRYVKAADHDGRVIRSETFLRNLRILSAAAAHSK